MALCLLPGLRSRIILRARFDPNFFRQLRQFLSSTYLSKMCISDAASSDLHGLWRVFSNWAPPGYDTSRPDESSTSDSRRPRHQERERNLNATKEDISQKRVLQDYNIIGMITTGRPRVSRRRPAPAPAVEPDPWRGCGLPVNLPVGVQIPATRQTRPTTTKRVGEEIWSPSRMMLAVEKIIPGMSVVRDRNLKAPKMGLRVTDRLRGLPRVLKTRPVPVPVPTRTRNPRRVTPPVVTTRTPR
ncbi:hypothetical protein B0H13DRAFT_1876971 [Mycena leptocephala]|nr:hypothetical protein B0H13DRAFT_1876971 [Mycena leptocephala]